MRKQSIALFLVTVCVSSIDGAPTAAPTGQKRMSSPMEVMRLPQHQTACIVDVIQNNTDPETHIVSREVEVLLTKCFAFPVQRCPEGNTDCMMPASGSVQEKAPIETTEETARAEDATTIGEVARSEVTPPTTATFARSDEPATTTEATGRADTLAPEQAKKRQQTTESPARAEESTEASGRADTLAPEQAKKRQQTTENPARAEESTEASGRADTLAPEQAKKRQQTTESTARAEESTEASGRADTLAPEQAKKRQQTTESPAHSNEIPPTTVASVLADSTSPVSTGGPAQTGTLALQQAKERQRATEGPIRMDDSTTTAPARADDPKCTMKDKTEMSDAADTKCRQTIGTDLGDLPEVTTGTSALLSGDSPTSTGDAQSSETSAGGVVSMTSEA